VEELLVCEDCGLEHRWVRKPGRRLINCRRCHSVLRSQQDRNMQRVLAGVVAALIVGSLANILPILEFDVQGRLQPCWIVSGVFSLIGQGYWPVALLVAFCGMMAPFTYLLALSYTLSGCLAGINLPGIRVAWRVARLAAPWALVEVYAVALMVAVARLDLLGQVYLKDGTWYAVALFFLTTAVTVRLDVHEVEECLDALKKAPHRVSPPAAEGEAV
jgi:paraquat-inducible protein A